MAYYHSKYGSYSRSKRKSKTRKVILFVFVAIVLLGSAAAYYLYRLIFSENVWTPDHKEVAVFIPTGSDFEHVKTILYAKGLIIHRKNFEWWAEKKKYPESVKPGKYFVHAGMNNNDLVNLLRSGNQTPVQVIFNNVRDIFQLAAIIQEQIEADSASISERLSDSVYLSSLDLNKYTVPSLFIPNTYEFYWTTDAQGFIDRMIRERSNFWSGDRSIKASRMNMTKAEIVTLASIVEKETNMNSEKATIAGVYVNRLNAGWRLQADPTVIFALNDYSIRRVLNVHKNIDSPYNTYQVGGLPPGPICIPSISSIDAVLNYEDHDYLFFCAKDDLSGYHAFAKTNAQHTRNARKYQKALDKLKIYK